MATLTAHAAPDSRPKDLNNPMVYVEALVRAAHNEDTLVLAQWIAQDQNVTSSPFWKWYKYFSDRLIDIAPRPELGFQVRVKPLTSPPKIGRNDLCPCGSGKKFKRCHMDRDDSPVWKLGSPTPQIRAMAVSHLIHTLPIATLEQVPVEKANPLACAEMSQAYFAHGRMDLALPLLKSVLDGARDDPHMLFDYWVARYAEWLVEDDRSKEAETFLMDEYDAPRKVQQWQVAQKLAAFYLDQGDPDNAQIWVDTALEGNPDNPFTHYLKGMLHHILESWDKAVESYEQARALSAQFRDQEKAQMLELLVDSLDKARNQQPLDGGEENSTADDASGDLPGTTSAQEKTDEASE
jgi:hypothetical protein